MEEMGEDTAREENSLQMAIVDPTCDQELNLKFSSGLFPSVNLHVNFLFVSESQFHSGMTKGEKYVENPLLWKIPALPFSVFATEVWMGGSNEVSMPPPKHSPEGWPPAWTCWSIHHWVWCLSLDSLVLVSLSEVPWSFPNAHPIGMNQFHVLSDQLSLCFRMLRVPSHSLEKTLNCFERSSDYELGVEFEIEKSINSPSKSKIKRQKGISQLNPSDSEKWEGTDGVDVDVENFNNSDYQGKGRDYNVKDYLYESFTDNTIMQKQVRMIYKAYHPLKDEDKEELGIEEFVMHPLSHIEDVHSTIKLQIGAVVVCLGDEEMYRDSSNMDGLCPQLGAFLQGARNNNSTLKSYCNGEDYLITCSGYLYLGSNTSLKDFLYESFVDHSKMQNKAKQAYRNPSLHKILNFQTKLHYSYNTHMERETQSLPTGSSNKIWSTNKEWRYWLYRVHKIKRSHKKWSSCNRNRTRSTDGDAMCKNLDGIEIGYPNQPTSPGPARRQARVKK